MATILVVDDSPVSRRLLSHALRQTGHAIVAATDGNEALTRLAEAPIDLVIADLAMPEMDGLTLLHHIRAADALHNVRVMMLTASGQEQDRLAAEAAGANGFLTKPASSRDLIAAVDRLLS
jgi:CheY-like chemotaxis protein